MIIPRGRLEKFVKVVERVIMGTHRHMKDGGFRHYCVIVDRSDKKSSGGVWYCGMSMGGQYGNRVSRHAEMDAIRRANGRLRYKKVDVMLFRLTAQGRLSYSRPCQHCVMEMMQSQLSIHHVYYSMDDGSVNRESLCNMEGMYVCSGERRRNMK